MKKHNILKKKNQRMYIRKPYHAFEDLSKISENERAVQPNGYRRINIEVFSGMYQWEKKALRKSRKIK